MPRPFWGQHAHPRKLNRRTVLSPDPVATDTITGALLNRYYYANNNPYTHRDPDGRQICNGGFSNCHEQWQAQERRGLPLFQSGGAQAGPNPVEEFMTMGFGFKAEQQLNSGDYLGWAGYTAAGMLAGAANVVVPGVAKGTTALYRAVTQAELRQIQITGGFEAGVNSLGGKWFAETVDHARQWWNMMNGNGISTIIQVRLPSSQADRLMRIERLDGIGPARYGKLDQLNEAIIRVLGQ